MIQKKIHYCWFGKSVMPSLNIRCVESWAVLNGYEFVLWDESNIPNNIPILDKLKNKKQWAFMSDYIRLYALYHYGGIYLDTDIEVVKDFSPLLYDNCFFGEESPGKFNNAVIGATPHSPFIKKCLEYMEHNFMSGKILYSPEVVTNVYNSYAYKSDLKVYPSEFFYPYNPFRNDSLSQLMYQDVSKNTYAIHHWSNSWKKSLTIIDLFKRFVFKVK